MNRFDNYQNWTGLLDFHIETGEPHGSLDCGPLHRYRQKYLTVFENIRKVHLVSKKYFCKTHVNTKCFKVHKIIEKHPINNFSMTCSKQYLSYLLRPSNKYQLQSWKYIMTITISPKIRHEIFKDHLQRESKHIFCRAIYSEVCAKIKMSRGICPPPLNRHLDVQLTTCLVSPR